MAKSYFYYLVAIFRFQHVAYGAMFSAAITMVIMTDKQVIYFVLLLLFFYIYLISILGGAEPSFFAFCVKNPTIFNYLLCHTLCCNLLTCFFCTGDRFERRGQQGEGELHFSAASTGPAIRAGKHRLPCSAGRCNGTVQTAGMRICVHWT